MMRFRYTRWDGSQAVRLDAEQVFEKLAEYLSFTDDVQQALDWLLRQGAEFGDLQVVGLDELLERVRDALRDLRRLDETLERTRELARLERLQQQLIDGDFDHIDADALRDALGDQAADDFARLHRMMMVLQRSGVLQAKGGKTALSPKGVRKLGRLALRDIYQGLLRDRSGGHATDHRGPAQVRPDQTRPYQYGEPMNLDLVRTLKKALARGGGVPLALEPGDFEVFDTDLATSTATVLLLDMSWSMSWEGRFAAAKKVAMAMETLIRTKYPRDYFAVVGFYTRAVELPARDLPEATWNMGDPFTNLQDGLRLGTRLLERQRTRNKHLIVVTDGQPTAYFSGERLYCEWPLSFGGLSMRAAQETLKEVKRVTQKGITINTFMLDDSPSLRAFVESMTRINKGRALYSSPDRLGEYLLVDYLGKKRKRV